MAGPSASAAGKVSSRAAKLNERRRVEVMPEQVGGTANNICLSNSSDDALALKRAYFSARVIPIVMSWPLCPTIFPLSLSTPPSLSFSLFLFASCISIRRGTCHRRVDKPLVHIGVGTCEDVQCWLSKRSDGGFFFLFMPSALPPPHRTYTYAHTYICSLFLSHVSKDIPKSCTMTNDQSRTSHLYYATCLSVRSRNISRIIVDRVARLANVTATDVTRWFASVSILCPKR